MREVKDLNRLNHYLERHHFDRIFDTKDIKFRLYKFEKGELLSNAFDTNKYFIFIVSGKLQVNAIRVDGSSYYVASMNDFTCMGDVEFGGHKNDCFEIQALSEGYCIVINLRDYGEVLKKDVKFLTFILKSIAEKLYLATQFESGFSTLEEKLIFYIKTYCNDNSFKNVTKMAESINCSRRQLHRIITSMCEDGRLIKSGNGSYKLIEK